MVAYKSEIRSSRLLELSKKVADLKYQHYLRAIHIKHLRMFEEISLEFDFPITALVGPNGSGKSTILGACACSYTTVKPTDFFVRSRVGDEVGASWKYSSQILDRTVVKNNIFLGEITFAHNKWENSIASKRQVKFLDISRTVPAINNPHYTYRRALSMHTPPGKKRELTYVEIDAEMMTNIRYQAERILGSSLKKLKLIHICITITKIKKVKTKREFIEIDGRKAYLFTKRGDAQEKIEHRIEQRKLSLLGGNDQVNFSEFGFSAGEASVIRTIYEMENLSDFSLVLIEEVENGLHPVAVTRFVEYLADVCYRKNLQIIFTSHSDYALAPPTIRSYLGCAQWKRAPRGSLYRGIEEYWI